jgi:methyl-accepting chemotaxis protein
MGNKASILTALDVCVDRIISGDYHDPVDVDDEVAGRLQPMVGYVRDRRLRALRDIVDIWVEQANLLFAATRLQGRLAPEAADARAEMAAVFDLLTATVDRIGAVVQPRLRSFDRDPDEEILIQLARADHATFKLYVLDTLAGRGRLKDSDLPDHHACRFGKWYDGVEEEWLRSTEAYRKIHFPHVAVHVHGQQALTHFHAGEFDKAVEAAARMEEASLQVFEALDSLALLLSVRAGQAVVA